jgi:hypothetical protein
VAVGAQVPAAALVSAEEALEGEMIVLEMQD